MNISHEQILPVLQRYADYVIKVRAQPHFIHIDICFILTIPEGIENSNELALNGKVMDYVEEKVKSIMKAENTENNETKRYAM